MKIFVSAGSASTSAQDTFLSSIEAHLRLHGFEPKTVGRNTFASQQPLRTIEELMDECSGVVVIALERKYVGTGLERRGGEGEKELSGVVLPTPWVQVEAAMAYSRRLPLLLITEDGLHEEGLIDEGFDWYVQRVQPIPASLSTPSFVGVFDDWKRRVLSSERKGPISKDPATSDLTIGQLVRGLKVSQLWSVIAALAVLVAGAFSAGVATHAVTSSAHTETAAESVATDDKGTGNQ